MKNGKRIFLVPGIDTQKPYGADRMAYTQNRACLEPKGCSWRLLKKIRTWP